MDYFIAIILALVAIVVMFFTFASIGNSDVKVPSSGETRRGRSRRARHTSHRYKEDVLDRESEELIARELAKNPAVGLNTDSKTVQPNSLETAPSHHAARRDQRSVQHTTEEVSARRVLIDKEQGFKTVMPKQRPQKEKAARVEKTPAAAATPAVSNEMERKLNAFFNNSRKGHKGKFTEDVPQATSTGGHVEVKQSITTKRGWDEL